MSSDLSDAEILKIKRKELDLLKQKLLLERGLPHLYGFKFYKWSREFFNSRNKDIFLVAANQLGKSSSAIRKMIHWATETNLWPELWPQLNLNFQKPNLFWYMYPNLQLATNEFESKWSQFLPSGEYKKDLKYGWEAQYHKGLIDKVIFNSGVTIQFKTYSQKLIDLQAASVFFCVADEEMPVQILPEIKARLNATDGYFAMVFTATLGQLFWKDVMEPTTSTKENFPEAFKQNVSLYDSQTYEDGSASPWTDIKIRRAIQNCPSDAEIQRRIYGRFVKSEGLMVPGFSIARNMSPSHPLPKTWHIYGAIDPGSGGEKGHPTGIIFLAVNPQYTKGRFFRAWRGDGIQTDSQASLNKFRELRGNLSMAMQIYDYAAKDFFIVASNQGENFVMADKSRDRGFGILNTLFKNDMVSVQEGDPELGKFVTELMTLGVDTDKREACDDLIDPARYCVASIPWDFSSIELPEELRVEIPIPKAKTSSEERRDFFSGQGDYKKTDNDDIDAELDYWNEQY